MNKISSVVIRKAVYNIEFPSCGCLHQNVKRFHLTSESLVVPKNKGSVSSQQWLTRHLNDPYVMKAKKLGYRARSAFKLLELDNKFKFLKPGQIVVDCGAAPGAWSQVIVKKINSDGKEPTKPIGKVVAVDLLDIEPLLGALTLPNSDFTDPKVQKEIVRLATYDPLAPEEEEVVEQGDVSEQEPPKKDVFDVILSDMAPNASGHADNDHFRIIKLFRFVLDFALLHGKTGSTLLGKLFDGSDKNLIVEELKTHFKSVKITKPQSSRDKSAEIFVYCKDLKRS